MQCLIIELDILPIAKARGVLSSRRGFPASSRRAWFGFHRPRSDRLSTGSHPESRSQNVVCSIDITVMDDTTFGARPDTYIKRKRVKNMSTVKAALGRGVPLINFDEGTSIPHGFVLQLPDKFSPSHIGDGLRQAVVLDHVLDGQTLDADDWVFAYDLRRELVLIIPPSIRDTGVDTRNDDPGLVAVLAALLFLGMPSLSLCQFLLITRKEFGIAVGLPLR